MADSVYYRQVRVREHTLALDVRFFRAIHCHNIIGSCRVRFCDTET